MFRKFVVDTWGRAAVPRSPEGSYRNLWQVCDVIGSPRPYPAWAMDQRGLKIKGDHWDVFELVSLFDFVTNNTGWNLGRGFTDYCGGLSPDGVASAIVYHFNAGFVPTLHAWSRMWVPSLGQQRMLFHQSGASWTIYDLADNVSWAFGTPPPRTYICTGHVFSADGPDKFGYPWLNPI